MRHREHELQVASVRWFRLQYPEYAPLLFAVPNGGARDKREGARLKAEGVTAGVADLLLLLPRVKHDAEGGTYYVPALCIEMKTDTGRQQATQRAWQSAVESEGYKYIVVRSLDEFIQELEDYIEG